MKNLCFSVFLIVDENKSKQLSWLKISIFRLLRNCESHERHKKKEIRQVDRFCSVSTMANDSKIEKHILQLPNIEDAGKLAFTLFNVFTPEECQEWIDMTEKRGYGQALIGRNQVFVPGIRNNSRCMIDDVDMADKIFQRIKPYLPETFNNFQLVGLNERLRFLRYDPGEKFKRHYGNEKKSYFLIFIGQCLILDGIFPRNDGSGEQSFIVSFCWLFLFSLKTNSFRRFNCI